MTKLSVDPRPPRVILLIWLTLGLFATSSVSARSESRLMPGFVSVYDFGAKGDGYSDDSESLQNAFDSLKSAAVVGIYLPPGRYVISRSIHIPYVQFKAIVGAGRNASVIFQSKDDLPILMSQFEDTHDIQLENITLQYSNQQSEHDLKSVALEFSSVTNRGNGWYGWNIRGLIVRNARVGLGIVGDVGQKLPIWGLRVDDAMFGCISHTAISLSSPEAIGMPTNMFLNTRINNTKCNVKSEGPAIELKASEVLFENLDVEGWYGEVVEITGGSPVTFQQMHVESHVWTKVNTNTFYLSDGSISFTGLYLSGENLVPRGKNMSLFFCGPGCGLHVTAARIAVTSAVGAMAILRSDPRAGAIALSDVVDVTATLAKSAQ